MLIEFLTRFPAMGFYVGRRAIVILLAGLAASGCAKKRDEGCSLCGTWLTPETKTEFGMYRSQLEFTATEARVFVLSGNQAKLDERAHYVVKDGSIISPLFDNKPVPFVQSGDHLTMKFGDETGEVQYSRVVK